MKMDDESSNSTQKMMKDFYRLQEERVETYKLFDEGFQAYLSSAPNYNFPMYRQLVHEITETFKKISESILKIKSSLEESGWKEVVKYIDKIQEEEKTKLDLTAKLQIATQNCIDQPSMEEHKHEVKDHEKKIKEIIERINEHLDELKYESEDIYNS